LPLSHLELDKEISVAKSYIYVAAYWIIRSAFTCSSQITDLTPMKTEQVHVLSLQLAYIYIYADSSFFCFMICAELLCI
jgi:hypothetical protein